MRDAATAAVGIDIGGTKIAGGLVGLDGEVLHRIVRATPAADGAEAVFAEVAAVAGAILAHAESRRRRIAGIGVGTPGQVDGAEGRVLYATAHLPGWSRFPLQHRLEQAVGRPVAVDNDGNCAALAEWHFGAARGARSAVVVTLGTGIGGGIILDGHLLRGAHGMAGSIGHVSVDPLGPPCDCGNRGCIQQLASGRSVNARAGGPGGNGHPSALGGDDRSVALSSASEALGRALAAVANIVDPEVIVIGGGLSAEGERLLAPLRKAFQAAALPPLAAGVRIARAQLGADAGLIGAALLWLRELKVLQGRHVGQDHRVSKEGGA